MRDKAVALARGDFRVFPLLVNGKTPSIEGWPVKASNDPAVVARMWTAPVTGESLDNNIGVVTGGDFCVIDVDVKDGKPGLATLETLVDLGLDTRTQLTRSPTGSLHYYYRKPVDRPFITSAEKHLGPGIDTRGEGGYVVGAGSEINGEAYECLDDCEMLEAPEWLLDRCKPAAHSGAADVAVLGESDTEANILRAIDYLTKRAPEAVEGSGGNAQTYNIACEVIGYGVSEPETFQLMLLHWNDDKAHPPWAPEELERIVGNAARYRQEPEGNRSAAADFSPVSYEALMASAKPKPPSRLFRVPFAEVSARALGSTVVPLIEGYFDPGEMSVVYGDSNSGKTFLTLDMALCMSASELWNGHATLGGPVIYVAAEGGSGIFKRIEAWMRQRAPAILPKFETMPCPIDLLKTGEAADVRLLISEIQAAAAEHGEPARMVVIDTLSRALSGGDENAPTDMGAFVKNVDRIREETGAHVQIVHHSGKNKAAGARGHSLLRAATSTEIEIEAEKQQPGIAARGTITVTKQRDREYALPVSFELEIVNLGVNASFDTITSCVPVYRGTKAKVVKSTVRGAQRAALYALAECGSTGGIDVAVSASEWLKTAQAGWKPDNRGRKSGNKTISATLSDDNFRKYRKELEKGGYVQETQQNQWLLTPAGITEITGK